MKHIARALFFVSALLSVTLCASALGALDGKMFAGQVGGGAKATATTQPDTFEFANGKFRSSFCVSLGYGPAKYTATAQGNAVSFEAESANKTGGKMKCSGMVRGQDIEGIFTSTENKKTSKSWFKGRLK